MSGFEFGMPQADELLYELVVLVGDGHGERRHSESSRRVEESQPAVAINVLAFDESAHELVRAVIDAQVQGRDSDLCFPHEQIFVAVIIDEERETRGVTLVFVSEHVSDWIAKLVDDVCILVREELHKRPIASHCG